MGINIEMPFAGMTWGELRAFVALGADFADDDTLDYAVESDGYESVGLAIYGASIAVLKVAPDGA